MSRIRKRKILPAFRPAIFFPSDPFPGSCSPCLFSSGGVNGNRVNGSGINCCRINNDSLFNRSLNLYRSLCFGRFAGSEQSYYCKRHKNYNFFHFANDLKLFIISDIQTIFVQKASCSF